jgi:hypothetical protein
MELRHLTLFIVVGAISLAGVSNARAQDSCHADSARSALADSLMTSAGEEFEDPGSRGNSSIYVKLRRAVEVAPLTHDRWKMIWQVALFANRPDTAVAMALLALQRWPRCAVGETALVQAKALLAGKRKT